MASAPREFEISDHHVEWLKSMAAKHGLPDESKALRVLLEYGIQDGDEDAIFVEIRCANC